MARNPEETRIQRLTAGLISSGTAVTGQVEVDFPHNAWLVVDCLAAGTTNSVQLSTNSTGGNGGSAVAVSGLTALTGFSAGLTSYAINDKLGKYLYANVSGTGNPTMSVSIVCQGYANSSEVISTGTPING